MLMLREHLPRSESATGGRMCHALNRGLRSCAREDLGKYHGGQRYSAPDTSLIPETCNFERLWRLLLSRCQGHSSMSEVMCVLKVGLRHGTI
jgi:hypothetical protein